MAHCTVCRRGRARLFPVEHGIVCAACARRVARRTLDAIPEEDDDPRASTDPRHAALDQVFVKTRAAARAIVSADSEGEIPEEAVVALCESLGARGLALLEEELAVC